MHAAFAVGSVARGTVSYKIQSLYGRHRNIGMAHYAPVTGQRVWKWNRAYTIVLGSTAMTSLATRLSIEGTVKELVVYRWRSRWSRSSSWTSKKLLNNICLRYGIN